MKKVWLALSLVFLWASPLFAQLQQTPNLGMYIIPFGYQNWHIPVNDNTTIVDTKLVTLNLNCTDGQVPIWASGKFSICGNSSGHAIYEGATARPARGKLRFLGAGVSTADNAGNDSTDITITGSALSISGTGLVSQTAPGSYVTRTLRGTPGNIICNNGDGIAGDPTCDVGSTVWQTDQSNTQTSGDISLAAAASFVPPTATGANPTISGRIAYDSTANRLKYGAAGVTFTIANTAEVQFLNANLTALSGLTGAVGKIPHFTAPGVMALTSGLETPCVDTGGQHLNLASVSPLTFVCGTTSTGGLSGMTAGAIQKALTATTIGNSIMTESGGNINIAGGLSVGSGPSLVWDTSAIATTDKTAIVQNIGGTLVLCTGAFTNGNIVKFSVAAGITTCVDGGAGGTGTWSDSSTNTGTNKTLVAVGAGGTNTITVPIAAYWDAASLTLPSSSTCTAAALTQINSGPSVYTVTCTDASTSTFEGSLILRQDIATVTFTLNVNDVDSSSQHFAGDFSAMCRNNGTTVNNTWGTSQSVDITMATAQNNYTGTTAAVTPNGTCSSGATLFWRFVVNTTPFTDDGDARVTGVLMKQAS